MFNYKVIKLLLAIIMSLISISAQATTKATTVEQAKPTLTVRWSPSTVVLGQSATFIWSSANTTVCYNTNNTKRATSGSVSVLRKSLDNYTASWTCKGPNGSVSKSATLTINRLAAPSINVPTSSDSGSYSISWGRSKVATYYEVEGEHSGVLYSGASNSLTRTNRNNGAYSYKVRACNKYGCSNWSGIKTITVSKVKPTLTVRWSPSTVVLGQSATFIWSSANTTVCYNTNNEKRATSGSVSVLRENPGSYTSHWTCKGPNGSVSKSATLTVKNISEPTIRYQHTDMLGSVIAETDSSGNVLSRSHYEPFGKRLGGDKAGVGFTGHLQDEDLNLTYMQARYYDPLIGRFYSNDPVGFRDVHSFNRYAYANNNPYKYVDPDGKIALILVPPPPPVTGNSQGAGNIKAPNITKQDVINSAAVTNNPTILIAAIVLTSTGNNDGGQGNTENKGQGQPEVGNCPSCGGETSNKPGKIADAHGMKPKEAKQAIHGVKGSANMPNNPDVEVCNNCGEVFPQNEDGTLGDSIGNINDRKY